MARTKKKKIIRSAKRRRLVRPKASPARKVSAPAHSQTYDIQGILADKILSNSAMPENGTSIENLIYNATPKVAQIGYGFGYSVGRELCLKQGEDKKFISVLDRIGLQHALYYPLKDSLIITSKKHKARKSTTTGSSIHVYESGVISGYLSMSTGVKMSTTEKRCINNGADSCQFVAIPMSSVQQSHKVELDRIIDGIAHTVTDNDFRKLNREYYRIMSYLPLLQQPLYEQVRKLLVMSGRRAAEYSDKNDTKRIINNIANYFGVRQTEVSMRKTGKSIIKLRYANYNSIYPYISMPTAMIVGFVSSAFNKTAEVSISSNKDKSYTATINFKDNSA